MEKIIIADDDRAIVTLISDALTDEGFETILAFDGNSAMDSIQQNPDVSLIVLDVMMPNIDGFQICRKIRDKISCPIIFVTAKNRTLNTLMGLELGGDDYITKPFVVKIFEPFYTSDQSRKVAGLGLSICKSIIESHGGSIRAETSEMGGLTVIFTLPG